MRPFAFPSFVCRPLILVLAAGFIATAGATEEDAEPAPDGKALVNENCFQCHRADNPDYPDHNLGWVFGKRYLLEGWTDNVARMEAIALRDEYISEPWSEADKKAMANYLAEQTAVNWTDLDRLGMGHFSVVHFPIALLFVCGLFELLSLIVGWPMKRDMIHGLAWLALVATAVAVSLGLILVQQVATLSEDLDDHRMAGLATLGFVIAAVLVREIAVARQSGWAKWLYRGLLVMAMISVGAAGHLGGMLVHGEYLPAWIAG